MSFDAAKIDPSNQEQMDALTEEQLLEVEKYNAEHGSPAIDDNQGGEGEVGAGAQPDGSATPEKFAGKYDTEEDLVAGVLEEIKALDLDPELFQEVLDEAKESGEYDRVEALYSKLGAQITKRQAATVQPGASASDGVTAADQLPQPPDLQDEKVVKALQGQTMQEVVRLPEVANAFSKRGVAIPTTADEFDALMDSNPALYILLRDSFRERWNTNYAAAKEYVQAVGQVKTHNDSERTAAKKAILDFVKKHDLEIKDTDIDAFISQASKSEFLAEDRAGIKFLRKGGLYNEFMAQRLPELLDVIRRKAEARGRTQGATETRRPIRTISTSGIRGSRVSRQKISVDPTDPDSLAALSGAQLDEYAATGKITR